MRAIIELSEGVAIFRALLLTHYEAEPVAIVHLEPDGKEVTEKLQVTVTILNILEHLGPKDTDTLRDMVTTMLNPQKVQKWFDYCMRGLMRR